MSYSTARYDLWEPKVGNCLRRPGRGDGNIILLPDQCVKRGYPLKAGQFHDFTAFA